MYNFYLNMVRVIIREDEDFGMSFRRFKRASARHKRMMNQRRYFMSKKKRREVKRAMNRFYGF